MKNQMHRYLVTLTNTKTWETVKLSVAAESEAHALHRGVLCEKFKYPEHTHHMATISLTGSNPDANPEIFEYIEESEASVFESIDRQQKAPPPEL